MYLNVHVNMSTMSSSYDGPIRDVIGKSQLYTLEKRHVQKLYNWIFYLKKFRQKATPQQLSKPLQVKSRPYRCHNAAMFRLLSSQNTSPSNLSLSARFQDT